MGLQSEKWFDNEKHATAFRMDTWDECGFSGWREIYQHTKGFLEAEQPEESEQEMKERLQKNYEKVYSEKYEQPEESDVSDMEVTDDEDEDEGATPRIGNNCATGRPSVSSTVNNAFRLHCRRCSKEADSSSVSPMKLMRMMNLKLLTK